ncbi:hypothetical protein HELRODRAFT_179281 [Helobdella robusta]|uniref:Apple domain-containing protein n=1 Tax=Helobdella robusta TaxID=6412 RepID=T1FEH2_HELRO|nr:hypothetical protein HELRODRAFT_179281 [Helobdella robusta]ESN95507.1 hypothetical protein HELRODRAFT_179281 [Helobdella robusta]
MANYFVLVIILALNFYNISGNVNIALGRMVRESSYNGPFNSFLVVDGLLSSPYCFKSQTSGYQWVQIDLIWLYQVDYVRVIGKLATNLLNVKPESQSSNTLAQCNCLTNQLNNVNATFQCSNGAEHSTRYITVDQASSTPDVMTICEVLVEGRYNDALPERANLLQNKNALMKTTFSIGTSSLTNQLISMVAGLVVDGIRDPTLLHGHCAHCYDKGFAQNWIQVDMAANHHVDYIALVSRDTNDLSVSLRLSNFIIGLTSDRADGVTPVRGQYPICATYPGDVPPATRVTLSCNANLPAYRYIFLHQAYGAGDGFIAACELEAYEPTVPFPDKRIKWNSLENSKLMSYTFLEIKAVKPLHCIRQCIKLGEYSCDSFNFNKQLNICQLNKHRNGLLNGTLTIGELWTFWTPRHDFLGNANKARALGPKNRLWPQKVDLGWGKKVDLGWGKKVEAFFRQSQNVSLFTVSLLFIIRHINSLKVSERFKIKSDLKYKFFI